MDYSGRSTSGGICRIQLLLVRQQLHGLSVYGGSGISPGILNEMPRQRPVLVVLSSVAVLRRFCLARVMKNSSWCHRRCQGVFRVLVVDGSFAGLCVAGVMKSYCSSSRCRARFVSFFSVAVLHDFAWLVP